MDAMRIETVIQTAPPDRFQQCVKEIMECEKEWLPSSSDDRIEIEAQRRQQVQALFEGAEVVDLVGHSTPVHRYLKLGDWVLDPAEAERLASYMPASVKCVRLIGCATASTVEGRAAAEALARNGLAAYGTLNMVYTTHFDKNGVKRGAGAPALREFRPSGRIERPSPLPGAPGAAPSLPGAPRAAASPPVALMYAPDLPGYRACLNVPRPLAWLGKCVWAMAAVLIVVLRWLCGRLLPRMKVPRQWVLRLVSPWGTQMPGLLVEPLFTFEIASGRETWTLEILFDFEYARLYSSTSSKRQRARVYKIRGFGRVAKTFLEAYLETAPLGVRLIHRHAEAGDRCSQVPVR